MLKHPFILIAVILSVIGILIATNQIKTPKIFLPKANVIGVTLSLYPSEITLDEGQETTFDLSLDSAGEHVTAIELKLVFEASKIAVTDITPTERLPEVLGKELSKPGEAAVILLSNPSSLSKEDKVVARIHVKALKEGTAQLRFDQSTKVSAAGKTGDVLGAIEPAKITVKGSAESTPGPQNSLEPQNSQANQVIEDYLNSPLSATEESDTKQPGGLFGGYQDIASKYIKGLINNINSRVEKEAIKFLD